MAWLLELFPEQLLEAELLTVMDTGVKKLCQINGINPLS